MAAILDFTLELSYSSHYFLCWQKKTIKNQLITTKHGIIITDKIYSERIIMKLLKGWQDC